MDNPLPDTGAKFDWYQATIQADAKEITAAIMATKMLDTIEDPESGGSGYKNRRHFSSQRANSHIGTVILYHDGPKNPSLRISGKITDDLASMVRENFPQHSVSRADVAYDFSEEGGFERTCNVLGVAAKDARVKSGYAIMPREKEKGTTLNLGSPQSEAMIRCYEKGKELLAKRYVEPEEFDPHHYRVEFQFRPQKRAKQMFAGCSPEMMLGYSQWVSRVAGALLKLEIPPMERDPHQTTDLDRSIAHMTKQYQGMLRKLAERENTRYFGIEDPTGRDLKDILFKTLGNRLADIWDEQIMLEKNREQTARDHGYDEE